MKLSSTHFQGAGNIYGTNRNGKSLVDILNAKIDREKVKAIAPIDTSAMTDPAAQIAAKVNEILAALKSET